MSCCSCLLCSGGALGVRGVLLVVAASDANPQHPTMPAGGAASDAGGLLSGEGEQAAFAVKGRG